MTDHTYSSEEQQAYDLGKEHALAAASWAIDGNTSQEHIARMVEMLDNGDPQADDYLPRRPDLSDEWADDLTPILLFEEITGRVHAHAADLAGMAYETLVGSTVDALADAYEAGVSDTFEAECERILRAALDPAPLSGLRRIPGSLRHA